MKKTVKILVLLISAFVAVFFVGCKNNTTPTQIDTPSVSMDGSQDSKILLISQIENAVGYTVNIDNAEIKVNQNYYDCTRIITQPKVYNIKVKALAKDGYKDSNYCEIVTYSNLVMLASPSVTCYGKTLSWTKDLAATKYVVAITAPNNVSIEKTVTDAKYNFSADLTQAGEYTFKVKAQSDNALIEDSVFCEDIPYTYYKQFNKPSNLAVEKVGSELIFSFACDSDAITHTLNIDDSLYQISSNQINIFETGHDFTKAKRYSISVKTNATTYCPASTFSQTYFYENYIKLATPVVNDMTQNGNYILISWQNVANAKSYTVFVNDEIYSTNILTNNISVSTDYLKDYQLKVQVAANAYGNYLVSYNSDAKYFASVVVLSTPAEVKVNKNGEQVNLTWNNVANADKYIVNINSTEIESATNLLNIAPYLSQAGEYTIRVKAIPAIGQNFVESNFSAAISYAHRVKLGVVSNLQVSTSNYNLTFVGVPHANSYNIYLNNVLKLTNMSGSPVNLLSALEGVGEYSVQVQAIAPTPSYYLDGDKSSNISFEFKTRLSTPTGISLNIVNGVYTLQWSAVPGSYNYTIEIDSSSFDWSYNSVNITSYLTVPKVYSIKIRANAGAGDYYTNSDFAVYSYTHNVKLATPSGLKVETDALGNSIASWNAVANAEKYEISVSGGGIVGSTILEANTNSKDLTNILNQAGVYYIKVKAKKPTNIYYLDSDYSDILQITKEQTLLAPQNITIEKKTTSELIEVKFNAVANSEGYNIKVNGALVYENYLNTSFDLGPFVFEEGEYTVAIQAIGRGLYGTSLYGEKKFDYEMKNVYDFTRTDYFIYGNDYDMYIDDLNELTGVIWYSYLYNRQTYKIYIPNISNLVNIYNLQNSTTLTTAMFRDMFSLILQTYPEFWAYANFGSTRDGNIYVIDYINLVSADHNHTFDANTIANAMQANGYINQSKKAELLQEYNERIADKKITTLHNNNYQLVKTYNAIESGRSDTWDEFAINSKAAVKVSTTQQLLMAVQYDKKPQFVGNSDVARTVYENAKTVLRKIIKNDFNAYQKVLAIFDWLTIENLYEYSNVEFQEAMNSLNIGKGIELIGDVSSFYLEGVLYDLENPLSVCDGIAKAFTLLCRIEGIEAIKCNGTASGGGHAWNKVKLFNNWYIIDSTWSDRVLYYNNTLMATATHEYFLLRDVDMPTHSQEWPKGTEYNTTNIVHNFYEETINYNTVTFDFYIDDIITDLSIIINYILSDEFAGTTFDFRFSTDLLSLIATKTDPISYVQQQFRAIAQDLDIDFFSSPIGAFEEYYFFSIINY